MLRLEHRKIIEELCSPLKYVFPVAISVCRCTFVADDAFSFDYLQSLLII